MTDQKTTQAVAPKPEGPPSRGWVDDAVDDIKKAKAKGANFDALPSDTQAALSEVLSRPEGQRAKAASELNHVKLAHKHAKRHLENLNKPQED